MIDRSFVTPRSIASVAIGLLGSACISPPGSTPDCTPRLDESAPLLSIRTGALADAPPTGYHLTASTGSYRITWAGIKSFSGSLFAVRQAGGLHVGCRDGSCARTTSADRITERGSGSDCRGDRPLDQVDFTSAPVDNGRGGFELDVCAGPLYLDLLVDCVRQPSQVRFVDGSGAQVTAPTLPFGVVAQ